MRFGSVCSGIEAASVAWHPLGWRAAFVSEIEKFPCAVLAHHYPDVPNYGDMTRYQEWPDAAIDALVGGTPCQGNSVAGLRLGLDDPRSQLMLTYGEIAARYRPRWLVWENVPGVLSVNGGRDFAALLGLLSGWHIHPPAGGWKNSGIVEGIPSAYGLAWRVLDAQYIRVDSHARAVPQRRRRVFVVGHLGDWRRAAAVLFEREGLQGHPAPRREAGKAAPTIPSRSTAGGGLGTDFDCDGGLIPGPTLYTAGPEVSNAICARDYKGARPEADQGAPLVAHALRADGFDASEDGTGRGTPLVPVAGAVACYDYLGSQGGGIEEGISPTLKKKDGVATTTGMAVRRLTPRECERLQGFPDDFTRIAIRRTKRPPSKTKLAQYADLYELGEDGIWTVCAQDGPRYKALGNSMAVNCMSWIGQRIQLMEEISIAALGDGDTAA